MTDLVRDFVPALVGELIQRYQIRRLIEDMKRDPRTLEDIGLTFEQFAAAQWEGHRRLGNLASYLRTLTSSNAAPAADRAGHRRVDHREWEAATR
jgi:hypothetical protein